ncbi:DUF2087 domain-containing protein [Clostridium amazonitimonense]|uniref:DUF2087 domain-containing protein n=1 Tax=Clostridium amazonitimonense TaxID=1499689 RepID=UPI0005096EDE
MGLNQDKVFWNASIEEIKKGYYFKGDSYTCLICGEEFVKGIIYKKGDTFYEAEKYAKIHVLEEHGTIFEYLLNMNKSFTGISDIQKTMLLSFGEGLKDKEIAKEMSLSPSTIRNHRFKLKEKEKQAKIFLAIMALLDESKGNKEEEEEELVSIHKTATMVDERYSITEKEKENTIKNYFDHSGKLKDMPSKEKKKIIVLGYIINNFNKGKTYTEKEINRILERIYEDYAILRRYLIEYGFMDRTKDCLSYWVKE